MEAAITKEEERRRVTSGTALTATLLLTKGVGLGESRRIRELRPTSASRGREGHGTKPRSRAALDPRNFPPVDDVPPVDDEPPVAEDEPPGCPVTASSCPARWRTSRPVPLRPLSGRRRRNRSASGQDPRQPLEDHGSREEPRACGRRAALTAPSWRDCECRRWFDPESGGAWGKRGTAAHHPLWQNSEDVARARS